MNATDSSLKKIKINDLKVGMFIVNIGRSWLSHPFLRNQLKITSEKQVQKMQKYGIGEVYIDPKRGMDVPSPEPSLEPQLLVSAGTNLEVPWKADGTVLASSTLPSTHEGEPDILLEDLQKPESVVFWEQNAGKVQEGLVALKTPVMAPLAAQVPYAQEIDVARVIQEEAQTLVRNIMHNIRMGKSIESERVKRTVNNMADSILRNQDALVTLTRIKKYDEYTFAHSLDVCVLSLSMARHLGLSREEMLEIGIGGLLHDVGKMRISPQIIKKPDALNDEEWVEVKKHPVYSFEIMEESIGIPEQSKKIALQHHERVNGGGYPFGLKGDSIDLFAQVAGIIDVYSAITNDRYYRKGLPLHEGIKQIYEMAQDEFNQFLVERFIQCIGIYPFGTLVVLDTEEIGIVCGVNPENLLRPHVLLIYKSSKNPYPEPFLADLTEKSENPQWHKRTIVMPLDPKKWNICVESYLSDILVNIRGK